MTTDAERAIERMRSDLFWADQYKERAKALDHLGSILRCETPGTVEEVVVRGRRWWQRSRDRNPRGEREIILTDDERREFRDWCDERARELRDRALELEAGIALGRKPSDSSSPGGEL